MLGFLTFFEALTSGLALYCQYPAILNFTLSENLAISPPGEMKMGIYYKIVLNILFLILDSCPLFFLLV